MMILSRRMSSDVMLTSIRTLFPLFRRLSSEHVCLDANVRNVKLIMPNSSLFCCWKLSYQRFKLGQTIVSNDPQSSPGPGCIKPSLYKRALNFFSRTITYCFEIIVTSSLNLKIFFATRPWTAFTVHQIRAEENRLLVYLDALKRQTKTLSRN